MPVKFRCPNCRHRVSTSRKNFGRKAICPYCKAKTYVPAPQQAPQKQPRRPMTAATASLTNPSISSTADEQRAANNSTVTTAYLGFIKDVMDDARDALRQSTLRHNIHNWDRANMAQISQAMTANQMGLTSDQKSALSPYPQTSSNTVNMIHVPQQDQSSATAPLTPEPDNSGGGPSKFLPLLLAGALGSGGGVAGKAIVDRIWPQQPATSPPAATAPVNPGDPASLGVGVE